jgi:hypothetical protein
LDPISPGFTAPVTPFTMNSLNPSLTKGVALGAPYRRFLFDSFSVNSARSGVSPYIQ